MDSPEFESSKDPLVMKILKYFNRTLKHKLNYPEIYIKIIQEKNKYLLYPNQLPMKLPEKIKFQENYHTNYDKTIDFLSKKILTRVVNVSIEFTDEYFVIHYNPGKLVELDLPLYSIICSYLPNGIDQSSIWIFIDLYKIVDDKFYIYLIMNIYPEIFKTVKLKYNWKEVYRGLWMMDGYIPDRIQDIIDIYPVTFKYLFEIGKINLKGLTAGNRRKVYQCTINLDDVDLFKMVISDQIQFKMVISEQIQFNHQDKQIIRDTFSYFIKKYTIGAGIYNYIQGVLDKLNRY